MLNCFVFTISHWHGELIFPSPLYNCVDYGVEQILFSSGFEWISNVKWLFEVVWAGSDVKTVW